MSCNFWSKWINVWKITKHRFLKQNANKSAIKTRIKKSSNDYLGFSKECYFIFYIIFVKNSISKIFKSKNTCCRTIYGHLLWQISGWNINFCKHIAQNPIRWWRHFFKLQFWAFICIAQKLKWHLWNTEVKLVQQHTQHTLFIYSKIPIRKFAWCDPRLTWLFSVVDLRDVRLQNGFSFWILSAKVTINHVPSHRKKLVTFRGFSWLELDPDPYLVWDLDSQGGESNSLLDSDSFSLPLWGYFGW